MTSRDLDEWLAAAGQPKWQTFLGQLAVRAAVRLAPQLLDLVTVGGVALLTRLREALVAPESVDTALDIARGIERDHGPGAPAEAQWPGAQRAEFVRDAIRQWMVDRGGAPDSALVNQVTEAAVGRLRAEQAAADRASAAAGGRG